MAAQHDTRCAVILAGGQSRRFGRDKTALTHSGQLLIVPLIEMLRRENFEVMLLGSAKAHFATLGCRILPDLTPFEGPLPAITNALSQLHADRILAVAADMPFLTPEIVRLLWQSSPTSALTYLEGEVLPAIYAKSALHTLSALVANGERRLYQAHSALYTAAHIIPTTTWTTIDPHHHSLININSPEDWNKLTAVMCNS